jgi:hypothetical protein
MLDAESLLSKTGSQLEVEKALLGVCKDFNRQNEIFENQEDMVDGTNGESIQSNSQRDSTDRIREAGPRTRVGA